MLSNVTMKATCFFLLVLQCYYIVWHICICIDIVDKQSYILPVYSQWGSFVEMLLFIFHSEGLFKRHLLSSWTIAHINLIDVSIAVKKHTILKGNEKINENKMNTHCCFCRAELQTDLVADFLAYILSGTPFPCLLNRHT